jgi:hypothetical protein
MIPEGINIFNDSNCSRSSVLSTFPLNGIKIVYVDPLDKDCDIPPDIISKGSIRNTEIKDESFIQISPKRKHSKDSIKRHMTMVKKIKVFLE